LPAEDFVVRKCPVWRVPDSGHNKQIHTDKGLRFSGFVFEIPPLATEPPPPEVMERMMKLNEQYGIIH